MARHRWLKVKPHTRICTKCGCGRVSERDLRDQWQLRYHLPTGESKVLRHTPECQAGPRSAEYLAKYAEQIATAAAAKVAEKAAKAAARSAVPA